MKAMQMSTLIARLKYRIDSMRGKGKPSEVTFQHWHFPWMICYPHRYEDQPSVGSTGPVRWAVLKLGCVN